MKKAFFFIFMMICHYSNAQIPNQKRKALGYYKIKDKKVEFVKIPFKMHYGKPLLKLKINSRPATLMIDNGIPWDQVWLFGSPLVDTLNLKPVEESSIDGAGEGDPTAAYTSSNLTLEFKDIVFYEQPVLVSPPAAGFSKMFPGADGQLCNTFFKHFIVKFDFIRNEITLYKPEKFNYAGNGSVLEMQENTSGTYSVPFAFETTDGKIYNNRVDIDFGGIYPFKAALNNKHNIQIPKNATETFSYAAQGKSTEYEGLIKSMTIGKYTFRNLKAVFGDEKTSRVHPGNLGVIGLPLFMKFDITFDYLNDKIYLDPNENFNKPFD